MSSKTMRIIILNKGSCKSEVRIDCCSFQEKNANHNKDPSPEGPGVHHFIQKEIWRGREK